MSTIIRLTFLEMRKKKILYLTLIFTVIFLALYGTAAKYAYQSFEANTSDAVIRLTFINQFISMGMYVAGFIISFLSIFSSVGAISSEIESGTYDAVLSKPIARYEIVLGRFIGILLMLIPYVTFLYLSIIGVNVFFGKGVVVNFTFQAIVKSLLTLYLLPLVLTSIGIFLSCSMSTMASGVIVVILYFCAMIGGILEKMSFFITVETAKSVMSNIGIATSLIMPSDVIYRKVSSLLFTTKSGLNLNMENMVGGNTQPSSFMMGYVILYIVVMIILALRKFQKRDL
ncbi:ABC transporter permease [Clostridium ganghwense]|uniref:ABC transporter permease subunit n=1 Tax=Clostridium ganghwense TaxID=312089 RepID=A0ABT4CKK6_9CLOT|nr:ABC transporter permease subunit [Clostridium ganghwense]MCY6369453.1 ABC transporter permease subunit [Clostridium ganghwense]